MQNDSYNVAVVGATGVVGKVIAELLLLRKFPLKSLTLLASKRSANTKLQISDKEFVIKDLATFDFATCDLVFFSAGSKVSEKYVPIAVAAGCIVIDNTSHFRYDPNVPLIIPEVNPGALDKIKLGQSSGAIIANPNCSTIQMLVALNPIYQKFGIESIEVATYQSVSGAGRKALNNLEDDASNVLEYGITPEDLYRLDLNNQQIAFNVVPKIDELHESGFTREEMKMIWETKKIWNDPKIIVNPTCVRVPVLYGHSLALHIQTIQPWELVDIYTALDQASGFNFNAAYNIYPTPLGLGYASDLVQIGRVRQQIGQKNGLNLWVVADNIRKGGALNSVQIAEQLLKNRL